MNYKVIPTPRFKRQVKKLLKKYSSLSAELQAFERDLMANPVQGQSLGQNTYKVRVAIKNKGKGKSGAHRVADYV